VSLILQIFHPHTKEKSYSSTGIQPTGKNINDLLAEGGMDGIRSLQCY